MDTSFLIPVVLIIVWGIQAAISTKNHHKERAELINRIMSKSLPEYVQAQTDLTTPRAPQLTDFDDDNKPLEDYIVPINDIEKDPVVMAQFLDSIKNNNKNL